MDSRTSNSIKNGFYSVIHFFVETIGPFILRTVLLRVLGEQYLGLNNLFHSIILILGLAEIGFGKAISFYLYKPIANNNKQEVCALLNQFKKIYIIIGLIVLSAGLGLVPFLHYLIKDGNITFVNIRIVYVIYLLETAINFLFFAHREALLNAAQKGHVTSKISIVLEVVIYTVRLFCLIKFQNYYLYILFIPILALARKTVTFFVSLKIFPQYKCQGNLSKERKKQIWSSTFDIAIHRFGETISNSLGSIIISSMLGLVSVAVYENYRYIAISLAGLVSSCVASLTASVGNSIATETRERNFEIFMKTNALNNWIVSWCSSCMLCLYNDFMKMWVGEKLTEGIYYAVVFTVYFYSISFRKNILVFKDASGNWKSDRLKPLISGVLNIVLMFYFINRIGSVGIIISNIIITFIIEFPWETKVIFNNYFERETKSFFLQTVKEAMIAFSISLICFLFFRNFECQNVFRFIVKGGMCFFITNLFYFAINYKNVEFKEAIKMVYLSILNVLKKRYKNVS